MTFVAIRDTRISEAYTILPLAAALQSQLDRRLESLVTCVNCYKRTDCQGAVARMTHSRLAAARPGDK